LKSIDLVDCPLSVVRCWPWFCHSNTVQRTTHHWRGIIVRFFGASG